MLKHKSKILILAMITLFLVNTFSICFAEEAVTTSLEDSTAVTNEEAVVTEEGIENHTAEEEIVTEEEYVEDTSLAESTIISEDQYLFGDSVVMDKLVDGNVYIVANNVTISGRIAGNLFVIADEVTFTEECVVQYSAYVSAKNLIFNGAAYDLYSLSNNVDFGATALIGRDFRTLSDSVDLQGIIIRNAIVSAPTITLPDASTVNDETSINESNFIYGSLIYYSNSELTVPEGYVQEGTFFNKLSSFSTNSSNTVMTYITSAITLVVFTLFIYGALHLRKNSNMDKSKELVRNKILPILGFGIIGLIVLLLAGCIFSIINITLPIGLLAFIILLLAIFISLPLTAILIANILSDKLPIAKSLIVLITSIIIWALTLIPYFNIIVYLFAIIFVLGYLVISIYGRPDKEDKEAKEDKEEKSNTEEVKPEEKK